MEDRPAFLLGKLEVIVTLTRAGFIVRLEWEWAQGEAWKNGVLTGGLEKLDGRTGPAVTSRSGHAPFSATPHPLNCPEPWFLHLQNASQGCNIALVLSVSDWGHNHTTWAGACPLWHTGAAAKPGSI